MLFEININEIACVIETTKVTRTVNTGTLQKPGSMITEKIPKNEIRRTAEVVFKSGVRINLNAEQLEILENKLRDSGVL